ncbi:hypothetical protein COCOBI_07-5470 [Coccomyxa sp. Obi]|nr:hypothetical protein COCOBI_07-5470 [Coccomyxa sp. Obi]
MATEAVAGPRASRSAAAEARRQRILQRGADRLNSITIGGKKGSSAENLEGREATVAPIGSKIAESGTIQQQEQASKEQVPAPVPHQHGSKSRADDAEAKDCRDSGAAPAQGGVDVDRTEAQARPLAAAKARADRWAQYEEPGSSGAAAAAQPIHTRPEGSNFLQALRGASQATHVYRLMLALAFPILTRSMVWNSVMGALPFDMRSAPLLQLLLLQLLLLQAAFLAASLGLQPQNIRPREQATSGGGMPLMFLLKLAGLTEVVGSAKAVWEVFGSIVDALAVYILMAAFTTTLEMELHGRTWFNSGTMPFS